MPPPPPIPTNSKTNPDLPIAGARADIVRLLREHDFLVVVGDTGSGKTTQLPAYLLEDDESRTDNDTFAPVAITQPRRVAATSVSRRVAEERAVTLGGNEVGYKVRFDSVAQRATKLTFMTDGVLVRECVGDGRLTKYKTIVLDEAHERSVDTDVLFGLVKQAVELRKGSNDKLRCVVASATLDAARFSQYFDGAPVLRVPGRSHPVDIYHSKQQQPMTRFGPADKRYVNAAVDVAVQIHKSQNEGHILIFLTGQDEIENACQALRREAAKLEDTIVVGERGPAMLVLPLYGALPQEAADRVFDQVDASQIRKVVVATNIAETSLTVPGVKYVVDPGYVKQKGYDPERAVASLVVVPISKIAAEQRAGRAGRTEAGQCYRLYSKACFDAMAPETIPEIRRSSMASVALALKSLRIVDVLGFDFLDAPDQKQLACALLELHALGALESHGILTPLGHAMASLALEPDLARAALESVHFTGEGATDPTVRNAVLAVVAMLSAEDVWYVGGKASDRRGAPSARRDAADQLRDEALDAHARFRHPRGDLISLLVVFSEYERACRSGGERTFARKHSLRDRALRFARKARDQLDAELARCERRENKRRRESSDGRVDLDEVCRALAAGLCLNAAERTLNDAYLLLPSASAHVQENKPEKSLVRLDAETEAPMSRPPDHICFHELRVNRHAKGSFARNVVVVDGKWLKKCRKRVGTADVGLLCGKEASAKAPVVAAPAAAAPAASSATAAAPVVVDGGQAVDAARARFLARRKQAKKKK
jgi:ATP-dependent RNA helicase DHX8/PRP22